MWPALIKHGTFAGNIPLCALSIPPDHAVYDDGMLIPAKLLVDCGAMWQTMCGISLIATSIWNDMISAERFPAQAYLSVANASHFPAGRRPYRN